MNSKLADSFLLSCIEKFQLEGGITYEETAKASKLQTLKAIRNWNNFESLFFSLECGGIKIKDNEVLTLVGNMLNTGNFKVFILRIDNALKKYTATKLVEIENLLLKKMPPKIQFILYSRFHRTAVYADWFQKINTSGRIQYACFEYFFGEVISGVKPTLSAPNQARILKSFHSSDCKAQGIDFSWTSFEGMELITDFLSQQKHGLKLIRHLNTPHYESAFTLETAAKASALRGLLPEGIHWKKHGHQWQSFCFTLYYIQSLRASNEVQIKNQATVFFIGDKGDGKTSTLRTLLGMPFLKKLEQSTDSLIEMKAKAIINHDPHINWKIEGYDLSEAELNIVDFKSDNKTIVLEKLLLTEESIFVLCFKLEKLLMTEAETIDDLCTMINILQVIVPKSFALLVATHAADTRPHNVKKSSINVMKSLEKMNLKVVFNESSELAFHLLENSTALSSTFDQVFDLRATFSKILFELPELKCKIHSWIPNFLDVLIDNFKSERFAVPLEAVLEYSKKIKLLPVEVHNVLQLGHRSGSLIYLGNDAPEGSKMKASVVFNVDALFQSFGNIIYDAESNSKCYDVLADAMEGIMQYETAGILDYDVFQFLTMNLDDSLRELLVEISLHFGIMLKADDPRISLFNVEMSNSESFLVPSMMPNWKGIKDFPKLAPISLVVDADDNIPIAEVLPLRYNC